MKPELRIDTDPLPKEAIESTKDFARLMHDYKRIKNPFGPKNWLLASAAVTLAGLAILAIVYWPSADTEKPVVQNPITDNTPLTKVENAPTYKEDSPCINPPLKGSEKPWTLYRIQNEKGGTLTHPGGSILHIAPGSFIDAQGNTVQGEVEIRYREYHDPIDTWLSGIPMTYDSAGYLYTFESAGMLDIKALQNGQELQLAAGKTIEVDMASRYTGSEYNLYQFDTLQRNWVYKGREELKPLPAAPPAFSGKPVKPTRPATTFLPEPPVMGQLKAQLAQLQEEKNQLEMEEPIKPSEINPDRPGFEFDILPSEFPELAAMGAVSFEVINADQFNPEFYHLTWDNVVLAVHEKGKSYRITLYRKNTEVKLVVIPVVNAEDLEETMALFEAQYASYEAALQEKEIREKELQQKFDEAQLQHQQEIQENEARIKQAAEQPLIQTASLSATTPNTEESSMGYPTEAKVRRVFQIDGLGPWNSDSPKTTPGPPLLASFRDRSGQEVLNPKHIFIIERERNIFFTFTPGDRRGIGFNRKKENLIALVLSDGRLAACGPSAFAGITRQTHAFTFDMQVFKKVPASEKEVRELLRGLMTEEQVKQESL